MLAARLSALAVFSALAVTLALPADAQTTYRWIDKATGKTVFSDQPPPPGAKVIQTKESKAPAEEAQVPYAVKQAAEKYPVVLYTAANCIEACKQGRDLLNGRGVPFSEKMLSKDEEIAELSAKLGGEVSVPTLFVGQQNFKGYEAGAWNNLLDLAGYPKSAPYGAKPSGAFAK